VKPLYVTLDASTFARNSYDLTGPAFQSIKELPKDVRILLVDLTKREIIKNWLALVKKDLSELEKKLRKPHLASSLNGKVFSVETDAIDARVNAELESFLQEISANLIPVNPNCLSQAMELYSNSKPPFGSLKKQDEFKDALTLLTLEDFAKNNDCSIVATSADGDWKAYCEGSDRLNYFPTLESLLEDANRISTAFRTSLTNFIAQTALHGGEWDEVNESLSLVVDNYPQIEVWAPCEVEAYAHVADSSHEVVLDENGAPVFDVLVNTSDVTRISLAVKTTIKYEVEVEFSAFDSLDRDYVHLNSELASKEESVFRKLLLNIEKDGDDFVSVDLAKEIKPASVTLNLGEMWPYE